VHLDRRKGRNDPFCETWFVLKYLLGYPDVRNYDGFWTEWGNLVWTPIEKP